MVVVIGVIGLSWKTAKESAVSFMKTDQYNTLLENATKATNQCIAKQNALENIKFSKEKNAVTVDGDVVITGKTLTLNGIVVDGKTTLNEDVEVKGGLDVHQKLSVDGNVGFGAHVTTNDLQVLGSGHVKSGLTVDKDLNVHGKLIQN